MTQSAESSISGGEFTEGLAGIHARRLLLPLDCCLPLARQPTASKALQPRQRWSSRPSDTDHMDAHTCLFRNP
jgi:hypothetical protein